MSGLKRGEQPSPIVCFAAVCQRQLSSETSTPSVSCRGYSKKKLSENMECEIMHVIVEEARESYR